MKISSQFKLGALVTESSHPVTANLSDVAKGRYRRRAEAAVSRPTVMSCENFGTSSNPEEREGIKEAVLQSLKNGGRIFFTGCGSTGA